MKRIFAILTLIASLAQRLPAQIFDASTQFSATTNPNSVWRYGFESMPLGSSFILYNTPHLYITNAIDSWSSSSLGTYPHINHNQTTNAYAANDPEYGIEWGLDEMSLHPGPAGQFSVLRFVAPSSDTYQITASFQGIDRDGTSTDVHVLVNNVALFNQQVSGFHVPTSFLRIVTLAQNNTVDFAVGYGANGNHVDDSTGIHAVIAVARPSISITPLSSSGAELAWATNFAGYALEYTTNFPVTAWTGVTNSVNNTNGRFSITISTEDIKRFFRLHKP